MQIEISQSRQFKYSIVYVVKDAISYSWFTTIMQHLFCSQKCFYFKTPDGAASISSPSYSKINKYTYIYRIHSTLLRFCRDYLFVLGYHGVYLLRCNNKRQNCEKYFRF